VIFDEASQITLPLAIMGMLAGKRYIFFGDQHQLPPVLAGAKRKHDAGQSVFGALADQGLATMLTETYRLNAELFAWPSTTFYAGRLEPATPAIAAQRIDYASPPRLVEVLDPALPRVFLDLGHRNATTRSFREAGVVLDLITALLEAGVPQSEIAVVTPYRAQGREIRSLLRQAVPDDELRSHIVIDTVERMQGQEREAVIVSLTTSQPAFAAQLAEFFFQPERLNVAVTRARSKLIVVGSRHVLEAQPEREEHQESVALWRDFITGCAYRAYDALGSASGAAGWGDRWP
jgi:DNA replication ATP-dependent helicase Dna2